MFVYQKKIAVSRQNQKHQPEAGRPDYLPNTAGRSAIGYDRGERKNFYAIS